MTPQGRPARFNLERQSILSVLSGEIKAIEHIGSTAVPGLIAKPTIDILLLRNFLRASPELAGRYAELKKAIL